ncbi:hypothetical protein GCM10023322_20880 [Rugosimonospora acidiphila]|uniref:Uncharacterized protein n=1 Tax=Rugosimonospora acidiphila TaxID=556531 RepID=A0ABP9RQW4_9ACTN
MERTQRGSPVPERRRPGETILYNADGVKVTDRWLVVGGRRYPIESLCELRVVRAPHSRLTIDAGIASGVIAFGIVLTARYLDPAGWLGAAVVLAVPLSLLVYGLLRRPRPFEIWAQYQGLTVRLLSMRDPRRFGQIRRALIRVQEWEPDLPSRPRDTAA